MKKSYISFGLISFLGLGLCFSALEHLKESKEEAMEEHEEGDKEKSIAGWYELRKMQLSNPVTGKFSNADYIQALNTVERFSKSQGNRNIGIEWQEMGPDNVGGRTRAVIFDKTNPNVMYSGGVSGGIFKSTDGGNTWKAINTDGTQLSVLPIGSLCQTKDGDIYAGTGNSDDAGGSSGGDEGSFAPGNGIYKMSEGSNVFNLLPSTIGSNQYNPTGNDYRAVNKIAASVSDNNTLYAATAGGLKKTTDGGNTWTSPSTWPSAVRTGLQWSVRIAKDGTIYTASSDGKIYRSTDDGASFISVSSYISNNKMELAVAPSNENYIYAIGTTAGGDLKFIIQSKDKGNTWTLIGQNTSNFIPLCNVIDGVKACQGWYDIALGVNSSDPEKLYLGGCPNAFTWSPTTGWIKCSEGYGTTGGNSKYIHPDFHDIVFHPTDSNVFFYGTDGGLFKGEKAYDNFPFPDFTPKNRKYNITQFYSVAASTRGDIMGGSQDNGTQIITYMGNSIQAAESVSGGDGFGCAISILPNSTIGFATVYNGRIYRASSASSRGSSVVSSEIDKSGGANGGGDGDADGVPFNTRLFLMESTNAANSTNIMYTNTSANTLAAGTKVTVSSKTTIKIDYTLTSDLAPNQSISIPDKLFSKLIIPHAASGTLAQGVYVLANPLDLAGRALWYNVPLGTQGMSMASSSDGDVLYVGGNNAVVKIAGFTTATYGVDAVGSPTTITGLTVTNMSLPGTSGVVLGLDVDPNDKNHVVATLGGFGTGTRVIESKNGTSFASIQGNLPTFPCYDAHIVKGEPNKILIASEFGIWATENGGTNWVEENQGLGRVPVFDMVAVAKGDEPCTVLYLGTHGRGFFRTTKFGAQTAGCDYSVGISKNTVNTAALTMYPNPVIDNATIEFSALDMKNTYARVYDMNGRIVKNIDLGNISNGLYKETLNLNGLKTGNYVIQVTDDKTANFTKKFVVVD